MLPVDPWAPWHAGKRLTINHCPPPKIPHAHLGSNAHIGYGDVVGAGFSPSPIWAVRLRPECPIIPERNDSLFTELGQEPWPGQSLAA